MKIPFLSFDYVNRLIKKEILQSFEEFLDSGWYILGERVKQFEKEYSEFNEVSHCVGVSNGLDALHLSLMALDVKPGDEVIVPSNTYIATVLAVSYMGAKPVFVEPDIRTYNIDPEKIEAAITKRTKVIMPVHLYGQACKMDRIMSIAKKYEISVVEDNAQSQGATFQNRPAGSWGHINGTSFYPGKNLGAFGDAGAITTNSSELADKVRVLRNYGSQKKYHNEVIGYNMRLDECQAAFLSVKLKRLMEWTRQRQAIAAMYLEALAGVGDLRLPETIGEASHVYHLFVVRTGRRDELQEHLNKHNVGTLIHYPIPPHLQPSYRHLGFDRNDFPVSEEIADTCLSLPMWPGMTEEHVEYIQGKIRSFFDA